MKQRVAHFALAAAALVAFASPATASAEPITNDGGAIDPAGVLVTYTGTYEFTANGSGYHCEHVEVDILFTTEDAHVESLISTGCETVGPLNELLMCHTEGNFDDLGAGWTVDVVELNTLEITEVELDQKIAAGCSFPGFGGGGTVGFRGNIHATLVDAPLADTLVLSGVVATFFGPVQVHGSLETTGDPETITID